MKYDPHMSLAYDDVDAPSLEVSVTIIDPTGVKKTRGMTWDNLTNPMFFLVANDLRPISEVLEDRPEILLPTGEKELPGTEGTAIDGVTGQQIIDGWRSRQGKYMVHITVHGDPDLLDQQT